MSTPAPVNPPVSPSKSKKKNKDRDKDRDRDSKEKVQLPGERLKIVVRRLPPNLPEEVFWQSVANWVTEQTVSWKAFYPGKPKKRANKENIPSRAYIAFKNPDQLMIFGREYDGHKFVDKAGNESYAIVEFAPYQKVPAEKKKADSRHATIEKDEDFISFVDSLKAASATEPVSIETLIASTRPPSPPKTTPLLEALKAEKQAQKDKEAIIRNHPHYKDILKGQSGAHRKEDKRKAAQAEAAGGSGKKGKKGAAPPPAKQVQIQAKASAQNGTSAHGQSAKSPGRPSRKHAAKASKEANPLPASNVPVPGPAPKDGPSASANAPKAVTSASTAQATPTQDGAPSPASPTPAPARRGRPVLGLGSRHFEAALSGVGVSGERKRRDKGKDAPPPAAAASSAGGSQETASQEKPGPTSPKRQRQRKEAVAAPDANGVSVLAVPAAVASVDGGGGGGGHRGGRRGRGGRGRGGPPRVG